MTEIMQVLHSLLINSLRGDSPVLSGNMKGNIELVNVDDREITIAIQPEFYDMTEYQKTQRIVPIKSKLGLNSYADLVNQCGGFCTGNGSKHWVNRSCFKTCNTIKALYQCEVKNELEL